MENDIICKHSASTPSTNVDIDSDIEADPADAGRKWPRWMLSKTESQHGSTYSHDVAEHANEEANTAIFMEAPSTHIPVAKIVATNTSRHLMGEVPKAELEALLSLCWHGMYDADGIGLRVLACGRLTMTMTHSEKPNIRQ